MTAPSGLAVRPTSDGLRETLFNILGASVEGARVLDAFAGTGAIGLEALSRGARHVTFVERDPLALRALRENVARCGAGEACAIIRDDFLRARRAPTEIDLALLDPPYDIPDLAAVVEAASRAVGPGGRIVLEHSRRRPSPEAQGGFERVRVVTAGDSALSFYDDLGS